MYMEEDILFYICKLNGYKIIYSPNVHIYHKEESSTKAVTQTNFKKRRFRYKNIIKSSNILLDIMKEEYDLRR